MPRAGEPRVTVRLSAADHAVLSAAAESAGVALGSLVRTAAVRYAAEIAGGGVPRARMRRAAAGRVDIGEPQSQSALDALARGKSRPVSAAREVQSDALRLMMDRQARLNKARGG